MTKMRLLIVGGTGTIGQAIVNELSSRHTLIIAGKSTGDVQVNIEDPLSIQNMFQKIGPVDAIIAATGKVHFAPLTEFTQENWATGLNSKLMGQINLVNYGLHFLNDKGSITLTSGILNRDPVPAGSSAAMINGALDGFVKAAAIELPRGLRINVVSPTVLKESLDKYGDFFAGFVPVPAAIVAKAYAKSVEGAQTGQVYCVG